MSTSEELVLDCYRLARHYHMNPQVFLDMTVSEVERHMYRTSQLKLIEQRAMQDDA